MRISLGQALYTATSWAMQPLSKSRMEERVSKGDLTEEKYKEFLGVTDLERPEGRLIWLHAPDLVSAQDFGELMSLVKAKMPNTNFLLTTEHRLLNEEVPETLREGVVHQAIPKDHPKFVANFLDHWKPDAGVWLSDSVYSMLVSKASKLGIPLIYANAGPSRRQENSFVWIPNFMGSFLSNFDRILAKSDASAKVLRRLNAPRKKLEVIGTMKSGATALPYDEMERARFVKSLENRPVWLAAHVENSEVATLGKAQRRVSRIAQRLMLIIDLETLSSAKSAAAKLKAMGLRVALQSEISYPRPEVDVFIVDQKRDLGLLYRVAPVSFLGGSLKTAGGNDPFEAAALGSAIIYGPNVRRFQNSYDRLNDVGGAIKITNSESLSDALASVISPDKAAEMAHAAWEVSSAGAEVNDRVFELLCTYLLGESKEHETA